MLEGFFSILLERLALWRTISTGARLCCWGSGEDYGGGEEQK
jgi:hypothetical protein